MAIDLNSRDGGDLVFSPDTPPLLSTGPLLGLFPKAPPFAHIGPKSRKSQYNVKVLFQYDFFRAKQLERMGEQFTWGRCPKFHGADHKFLLAASSLSISPKEWHKKTQDMVVHPFALIYPSKLKISHALLLGHDYPSPE